MVSAAAIEFASQFDIGAYMSEILDVSMQFNGKEIGRAHV